MKVSKIKNDDGTVDLLLEGMTQDDLKHLYVRTSLINEHVIKSMGDGFGDKKLPDTSFGCAFAEVLNGIWE